MLVKNENGQSFEITMPYYVKHKEHEWFLVVTETETVEITPWSVKVNERKYFPSFYENRVQDAIGVKYEPTDLVDVLNAYCKVTNKAGLLLISDQKI